MLMGRFPNRLRQMYLFLLPYIEQRKEQIEADVFVSPTIYRTKKRTD
jgi:hypothetical protein